MTNVILGGKQAVFVAMFVDNEQLPEAERLPDYQIALRAGYSENNVRQTASRLMSSVDVQRAISARKQQLAEQAAGLANVDAKRVLQEWAEIAVGDPTEIVGVRRVNCRHCWGFAFAYQRTDAELAKEQAQEMQDAIFNGREMNTEKFTGGGGYRHTRDANPACPECDGEGVEDVYVKDFRRLTAKQRKLIAGVKQGRYGIEIQFRDQDGALHRIAQYLGLLVEKREHSGPNGGPIQTAQVTYSLPSDPQEASRAWQLLMEGKTV
jgi:phage terminase small subunit